MSRPEFLAWIAFYRRWPFDDVHRFHRPAALIASGGGEGLRPALEWLLPPEIPDGLSAADVATMRAFGDNPMEY